MALAEAELQFCAQILQGVQLSLPSELANSSVAPALLRLLEQARNGGKAQQDSMDKHSQSVVSAPAGVEASLAPEGATVTATVTTTVTNTVSISSDSKSVDASRRKLKCCVFGSSSQITPQAFMDASHELARLLAERKYVCINGGGRFGCMGALNQTGTALKAEVIGCIHRMWLVDGQDHDLRNMRVADGPNLHHRKQLLYEEADCFIVLPGGMGTWDELWEVAAERQLGLRTHPICIINTDGYYDGFVTQMKRAYSDGLLKCDPLSIVHVASTPLDALEYCEQAKILPPPVVPMAKRAQPLAAANTTTTTLATTTTTTAHTKKRATQSFMTLVSTASFVAGFATLYAFSRSRMPASWGKANVRA
jgi:uncharacterized protein (TIGR00730 family)